MESSDAPNDAVPIEPVTVDDPLADVPELTTYMATEEEDKVGGLKLVADSVAQMRQTANNSLIFHPLNLAILVAILSVIIRYMVNDGREPFIIGTTCTGFIMIALVGVRFATQDHLWAAEKINWAWMGNADIIITKFGEEIIGAVIIDWVSGESRGKRKKAWRGEILGWTVVLRYRGKGVGTALLEEAIKESKKKGAETIEFADDHASKSGDFGFEMNRY
jgi:GNAT superfamily N-acetyltransferase